MFEQYDTEIQRVCIRGDLKRNETVQLTENTTKCERILGNIHRLVKESDISFQSI